MCGITGVAYADPAHPVDRALFRAMTSTLAHRGPDARGFLFARGGAPGPRRLSITDVAPGAQPMFNEDGTKAVVFNGEIYNYRALRAALEAAGHEFRTTSDTEAIVHAWEEWGDGFVRRLRGMFAIALWDADARKLLLARDRVGKKPLYWTADGDRIVFASEIKALLRNPSIKRELALEAIDDYLALGAVPAPATVWRGIEALPPAHVLVWQDGRVRTEEYWDLAFAPDASRSEASWLEEFDAVFSEAVRLRMVADVPLGAFLSGGIDSTAVVAAMVRASGRVRTTTVGFDEAAFSEADQARRMARALGAEHREVVVRPRAAEILPTLGWHPAQPFADSSALPTYYVSRAARDHVTVALSGDGGDETFAGYPWRYGLNLVEARLRRAIPGPLRRGVLGRLARVWPKGDRLPRPLRFKFLMRNLALDPAQAYFHDMSAFTPGDKGGLLTPEFAGAVAAHDTFRGFARHFERARGLDDLARLLYVDTRTWLADDILTKVDRMSMAVSLEGRSPLLDHEVMELAARLPSSMKVRNGTFKYLLRRHLAGRVPAEVLAAPKRGFSIPVAAWLRGELRDMAADLLLSPRADGRGYFQARTVQRLWDAHQGGTRDHSRQLWTLMTLELWHRLFVDPAAPVAPAGVV